MSLLGLCDYEVSSSEDEDDREQQQQTKSETSDKSGGEKTLKNPFLENSGKSAILPKPSFLQENEDFTRMKSVNGSRLDSVSVFSNPFKDKEDKKKAVLEQHVAMTVKQEEMRQIEGKKVCFNYRRGRCRFGAKCTYAHDSDVGVKKKQDELAKEMRAKGPTIQAGPTASDVRKVNDGDEPGDPEEGEEDEKAPRKKRPGLSEGIVPSKKAMRFHKQVYDKK